MNVGVAVGLGALQRHYRYLLLQREGMLRDKLTCEDPLEVKRLVFDVSRSS